MNRRSFLKMLGAGAAVVALPIRAIAREIDPFGAADAEIDKTLESFRKGDIISADVHDDHIYFSHEPNPDIAIMPKLLQDWFNRRNYPKFHMIECESIMSWKDFQPVLRALVTRGPRPSTFPDGTDAKYLSFIYDNHRLGYDLKARLSVFKDSETAILNAFRGPGKYWGKS